MQTAEHVHVKKKKIPKEERPGDGDFKLSLAPLSVISDDSATERLDFASHDAEGKALEILDQFTARIELVESVCGVVMDHKNLFWYLFHRFGPPNVGSDNKFGWGATYLFNTPMPGMYLSVSPSPNDLTSAHFSFWAKREVVIEVGNWLTTAEREWFDRALEWRETVGHPDWMCDWIAYCNAEHREKDAKPFTDWRETIRFMRSPFLFDLVENRGEIAYPLCNAIEYIESTGDAYNLHELRPARRVRHLKWRRWDKNDPLKPYAQAARLALLDIRRPVLIYRGQHRYFDAYGELQPGEKFYICEQTAKFHPAVNKETLKLLKDGKLFRYVLKNRHDKNYLRDLLKLSANDTDMIRAKIDKGNWRYSSYCNWQSDALASIDLSRHPDWKIDSYGFTGHSQSVQLSIKGTHDEVPYKYNNKYNKQNITISLKQAQALAASLGESIANIERWLSEYRKGRK